jgi:hypothetical protein
MPSMPRILASFVFLFMSLGPAWARSEKTLAYPRDQVWPTAVRFLVVDEHLRVLDKDADAGYVLFELREDKKTFRGSLEIMTVQVDGRPNVRFVIQIEDRPHWIEMAMMERLERKLRAEHGSPSPPPSKKPARPEEKGEDKPADKPADKTADKSADKKDEGKPREEGGVRISPTP